MTFARLEALNYSCELNYTILEANVNELMDERKRGNEMQLIEKLHKTGFFFFRHRSFIPTVLAVFFILEISYYHRPHSGNRWDIAFELASVIVALVGYGIRIVTIGYIHPRTSGRSIKELRTASLNTDGMYAVVRNPLYLGNFFIMLGISMLSQDWGFVSIVVLLFICFYIPIILSEEQYLRASFGDAFDRYAARTSAIMPDIRKWKRPELRFNFARVLRREHDGLMAIIVVFFAVVTLRESVTSGRICVDNLWSRILAMTLPIWGFLKLVKRRLKAMEKDVPR